MTTLTVQVKPNSKYQDIQVTEGGYWVVRLKASPVDGKANAELIHLLSKTYGVAKSSISIKTGASSRLKRVEIDDGL